MIFGVLGSWIIDILVIILLQGRYWGGGGGGNYEHISDEVCNIFIIVLVYLLSVNDTHHYSHLTIVEPGVPLISLCGV